MPIKIVNGNKGCHYAALFDGGRLGASDNQSTFGITAIDYLRLTLFSLERPKYPRRIEVSCAIKRHRSPFRKRRNILLPRLLKVLGSRRSCHSSRSKATSRLRCRYTDEVRAMGRTSLCQCFLLSPYRTIEPSERGSTDRRRCRKRIVSVNVTRH